MAGQAAIPISGVLALTHFGHEPNLHNQAFFGDAVWAPPAAHSSIADAERKAPSVLLPRAMVDEVYHYLR